MSLISNKLIPWHHKYGRHNLPWQKTKSPYAIWISEIMLQQTQVKTVMNYYEKFMKKFPTIQILAKAKEDEVLRSWSGLGYYARARNLHNSAKIIYEKFDGIFPENIDDLILLPGIGRSTAGAICAFAYHQKKPILDGNVKRVFTRFFGIKEWAGKPSIEKRLWQLVQSTLPNKKVEIYNQALMDLGSILCIKKKPQCDKCPISKNCQSFLYQWTNTIPASRPKKTLVTKNSFFLIVEDSKTILLTKKPLKGIWGGLWSFPEFQKFNDIEYWIKKNLKTGETGEIEKVYSKPYIARFTHYRLNMNIYRVSLKKEIKIDRSNNVMSFPKKNLKNLALPSPIKKIISDNI